MVFHLKQNEVRQAFLEVGDLLRLELLGDGRDFFQDLRDLHVGQDDVVLVPHPPTRVEVLALGKLAIAEHNLVFDFFLRVPAHDLILRQFLQHLLVDSLNLERLVVGQVSQTVRHVLQRLFRRTVVLLAFGNCFNDIGEIVGLITNPKKQE